MICCDGPMYASMSATSDALLADLFADPDLLTAGWIVPAGRAEQVEGGYRVTGRWSFGSGILHSERVVGGCLVTRGGELQARSDGSIDYCAVFLPRDEVTVHDMWFTTGLAGTSSNDYSVDDVFVPAHHTFDFFSDDIARHPLHAYHGFVFAKLCAVPLGSAAVRDRGVPTVRRDEDAPALVPAGEDRVPGAAGARLGAGRSRRGLVLHRAGDDRPVGLCHRGPAARRRAAPCARAHERVGRADGEARDRPPVRGGRNSGFDPAQPPRTSSVAAR